VGFPELPTVNKDDLSYRAFILGREGVLRRWIRKGISGWRLDVSDELPDAFLREIRRAVNRGNPDAAILGEVWEDASNKISYGSFRDFAFGTTHDSIMGYPFRNALLNWLTQRTRRSGSRERAGNDPGKLSADAVLLCHDPDRQP
jgi:4-alpha-glucanotransferase